MLTNHLSESVFTNILDIVDKYRPNSGSEFNVVALRICLLAQINVFSITSYHHIKVSFIVGMKLNDKIGSKSHISLAVQCICFSLPVQILNTLARRNVQICQKRSNISIVSAEYGHFCAVSFEQSYPVLTFIDDLLSL